MRSMILTPGALLAACATAGPQETDIPVAGSTSGYSCRSVADERFAGREATSELASEMLRASGARTVRWVQPGKMVTMDYREDRLTVHLDAQNRVTRVKCG